MITDGDRPARPVEAICLGLSDHIWSSMERCWAADPSKRPTISQAIASLEAEWGPDVTHQLSVEPEGCTAGKAMV